MSADLTPESLAFPRPKRVNVSLLPTGLTACQKRPHLHTNSHDRMSDCSVAALACPMDTLIPAFLRRQRNQRRLTLEMLFAKVGP